MPRRRQSRKAARQTKKRHLHNVQIKTDIKKTVKKLESFFTGKNVDEAKKALCEVISKLAKAAKKGIMHKNTSRRKAARLSRRLSRLKA